MFIDKREYELVIDYRNAFQVDAFQDRYTKLLQKYHYIVGDWGHEQLRLKGFYQEKTKNVDPLTKINTLEDYLKEYCAFGCAYFVLKSVEEPLPFKEDKVKYQKNQQSRRKSSYKPKQAVKPKHKKHDFVIRKGQDR
ncbi:YutD family protein [Granulicatella sp. 19428wC4_WM01]|nr:YutD family protein [Granulicatella sp. 19428wC4_WM01]TFU95863.1 DUF1027 domain-containing protein [Granulicatella sp. WM01]